MSVIKQLRIYRTSSSSVGVTLPRKLVKDLNLQPGDTAFWKREGNVVQLTFGRTEDLFRVPELLDKLRAVITDEDGPPLNAA